MNRLSLAFVVHSLDVRVGGMERQAEQLARRLVARGHEVVVLTWSSEDLDALGRRELRDGVEIVRVRTPTGMPAKVADRLVVLQMAAHLRRRPPDVLYAVHYRGASYASALRDLIGAPLAVKLACSGPKGDFSSLARLGDTEGIEALRTADSLVCLNGEVREEALAAGTPAGHLDEIRNGVDVAAFEEAEPLLRSELGLSEDDRAVLFTGRLVHQKRLHILLEATAQALASQPALCLLIAGVGPERQALEAQAQGLGIAERVRFLGSRSDVPRLLQTVDGFVLPSCSEGISNALLEALAAGAPAIVSRIPGNLEVVGDEAALLVELEDVESLREALVELVSNPAGNEARVAAGRRRLSAEFSFEVVASAYEELFRRLASGARSRSRRRFVTNQLRVLVPYVCERTFTITAYGVGRVRALVSRGVVGVKQTFDIEGDLLGRGSRLGASGE